MSSCKCVHRQPGCSTHLLESQNTLKVQGPGGQEDIQGRSDENMSWGGWKRKKEKKHHAFTRPSERDGSRLSLRGEKKQERPNFVQMCDVVIISSVRPRFYKC